MARSESKTRGSSAPPWSPALPWSPASDSPLRARNPGPQDKAWKTLQCRAKKRTFSCLDGGNADTNWPLPYAVHLLVPRDDRVCAFGWGSRWWHGFLPRRGRFRGPQWPALSSWGWRLSTPRKDAGLLGINLQFGDSDFADVGWYAADFAEGEDCPGWLRDVVDIKLDWH